MGLWSVTGTFFVLLATRGLPAVQFVGSGSDWRTRAGVRQTTELDLIFAHLSRRSLSKVLTLGATHVKDCLAAVQSARLDDQMPHLSLCKASRQDLR